MSLFFQTQKSGFLILKKIYYGQYTHLPNQMFSPSLRYVSKLESGEVRMLYLQCDNQSSNSDHNRFKEAQDQRRFVLKKAQNGRSLHIFDKI